MGNLSPRKEVAVLNRAGNSSCVANAENKRDKGKGEIHLDNGDSN